MANQLNLKDNLESSLPPGLRRFIGRVSKEARKMNAPLYLVGGAVRDLLLGEKSTDIDLTVEGDAIVLAKKLAEEASLAFEPHPPFGTVKITLSNGVTIDITSARQETYARPGALSTVSPGALRDDLFRRDFTVNAMAVSLNPDDYGELIDFYGGLADLESKNIRVLHDRSFTDDATRIWRALRYSARLDFTVEPHTLSLIQRDNACLDTITGDRIRYELECVLSEACPEKALRRAGELGVLQRLCPGLSGDGDLATRFARAREAYKRSGRPLFALYAALFAHPLDEGQTERLITFLKFDKKTARVLRDARELRGKITGLGVPGLPPAEVFHLLNGHDPLAIQAVYIESNDANVRRRFELYDFALSKVKLSLTGEDLKRLGVPAGPQMKEVLSLLLDAKLNGEIIDREDEEWTVRKWLSERVKAE